MFFFGISLSIGTMRPPPHTRMLSCFLLVLLLACVPTWCMDKHDLPKQSNIIDEPGSRRSFAEHYKFPMSSEYDRNSKLAMQQFGIQGYYNAIERPMTVQGSRYLEERGATAPINSLRSHPNFVDFYDGKSYTPSAYIRIADLLPQNPLGNKNPDVVIFMPQVRLMGQTALFSSLHPKAIIRGVSDRTSKTRAYQIIWKNSQLPGIDEWWLNDLSEVFKWPVFHDLERLGYNPVTIDREVAAYEDANPAEDYALTISLRIHRILKSSGHYLERFDMVHGDKQFNTYSLVFTRLDGSKVPVPWFQAPIFRDTDHRTGKIYLEKYKFDGKIFPVLDRIRYIVTTTDDSRGTTLVPATIVRPVRITPTIKFKTIYNIPFEHQKFGIVQLAHIKAPMVRLVPDVDVMQENGGLNDISRVFAGQRPQAHPLGFIRSQGYDRMKDAVAKWRDLAASKDAQEQRDSSRDVTLRPSKAPVGSFAREPRVSSEVPLSQSDAALVGSTTAAQEGSSKLATLESDSGPVDSSSQEQHTHRKLAAFKIYDAPARPGEQEQHFSREPVTTRTSTAPVGPVAQSQRIRSKLVGPGSESPARSDWHPLQSEHDESMPKAPRMPFKIPVSPVPESPMPSTPRLLPSEHLRDESASIRAAQLKSPPAAAADVDESPYSLEEPPPTPSPKIELAVDEESPRQEHVSPFSRFSTKRHRTRFRTLAHIDDLQGHQVAEPSMQENENLEPHLKQEAAATSAQADKDVGSHWGKHALTWTVQPYRHQPGPWPVRVTEYLHSKESPFKRPRENALDALEDHLNPALDEAFGHVKAYNPW